MSIVTQTVVETSTIDVPPVLSALATTTLTATYDVSLVASRGQTITINSPSPEVSALPTWKYTPTAPAAATFATSTVTATELDIYLQNAQGGVYSTWTISLPSVPSPFPASGSDVAGGGGLVYVVEPAERGWSSWTNGEKGGLIAGVVLVAIFLAGLVVCCHKRRSHWIAHDSEWGGYAEGGGLPGQAGMAMRTTVPVMNIPGPLDPRLATPYGYGQQTLGYGIRGGDGEKASKKRGFWKVEKTKDRSATGGANHGNEALPPRQYPAGIGRQPSQGPQDRPAFYRPPVHHRMISKTN